MNIIKTINKFFLFSFDSRTYVIRQKAFVLLWVDFCLILLFSASICINLTTTVTADPVKIVILDLVMIMTLLVDLVLLEKGDYQKAGNLLTVVINVLLLAGSIMKMKLFLEMGINTFFYLMIASLVIAAFFATHILFLITSIVYLALTTVSVVIAQLYANPGVLVAIKGSAVNIYIAIIAIYILSYLSAKITNRALEAVEEELEENKKLNLTLEQKVLERTEELQAAMEELSATNDVLFEAKNALWGEMEIAKKIQTVLLPESPRIDDYEIAACMQPAAEVGGDYYDIIRHGDVSWILIGDVSGHGVTAGLIMMMVQTAIRVVLYQNPDIRPSELLTIVNNAVTDNIKRVSLDKYMTLTALCCQKNASFRHAGLHQDMYVYRAGTDSVEVIETNGFWLGLMTDPGGLNIDALFDLQHDDVLFLYTDGITEAFDTNDELYSDEKLIALFRQNGKKSPHEIRDAVLQSLEEYRCIDDVTLVVIKKK